MISQIWYYLQVETSDRKMDLTLGSERYSSIAANQEFIEQYKKVLANPVFKKGTRVRVIRVVEGRRWGIIKYSREDTQLAWEKK